MVLGVICFSVVWALSEGKVQVNKYFQISAELFTVYHFVAPVWGFLLLVSCRINVSA